MRCLYDAIREKLLVFIGYTKDGVAIGLEALLDTLDAVFGSALQRNLTIGIHVHRVYGLNDRLTLKMAYRVLAMHIKPSAKSIQ